MRIKVKPYEEIHVMDNVYTKRDVRENIKVSIPTIDKHMKLGKLKYFKIGKSVRFTDTDINDWIRKSYPQKYLGKNMKKEQLEGFRKILSNE